MTLPMSQTLLFHCKTVAQLSSGFAVPGDEPDRGARVLQLDAAAARGWSGKLARQGSGLSGAQVFRTLDESIASDLFDPIVSGGLQMPEPHRVLDTEELRGRCAELGLALSPEVRLGIYDRIIVIGWSATLVVAPETLVEAPSFGPLESLLSEIGEQLLQRLRTEALEAVLAGFFERKRGAAVTELRAATLWTGRTLVVAPGSAFCEARVAEQWLNGSAGEARTIRTTGLEITAGWGNNLVVRNREESLAKFLNEWARAQYLYAALFLINRKVTGFLGHLQSERANKQMLAELRSIELDFFVLEYAISEAEHGHQGFERKVFEAFLAVWKVRPLVESISYKQQKIRTHLSALVAERYGFVQRNIRSLLVVIGTVEVLGAVVELIHLAKTEGHESHLSFGLLHLLGGMDADVLMTTLAVLLALLASAVVFLGVGEEGEK